LSYSQAGFLVTIRAVANLLVNIPAGMLVDIIGKKALLMALALLATGVPYFLVGVSHSFFWVAFFMAFVGVGNYLWHPAAISTLSEKYPQQAGLRHRDPRHRSEHRRKCRSLIGRCPATFALMAVGSLRQSHPRHCHRFDPLEISLRPTPDAHPG
jgi:MFS family permease